MSKKTTTGGVGFLGVLQIVLIVLKAFGLIDWPWLLVLWIEFAFVSLFLVFYLIICIIVAVISEFL